MGALEDDWEPRVARDADDPTRDLRATIRPRRPRPRFDGALVARVVIWSAIAVALIIAVPAGVQAARDALPDPIDDDSTTTSSSADTTPTTEATTTTTRRPPTTAVPTTAAPTTVSRRPATTATLPAADPAPSDWSTDTPAGGFANCDAARAAGAAPVYRGDPGFHQRLDRDRDGVGCE
jgi:cell division septation protein DedD